LFICSFKIEIKWPISLIVAGLEVQIRPKKQQSG